MLPSYYFMLESPHVQPGLLALMVLSIEDLLLIERAKV